MKMKKQNVRTIALVVFTLIYLLVGAAFFDYFESDFEKDRYEFLTDMKEKLVNKYNISEDDYNIIETLIIENKPYKAGPQWKFAGALYFSTVVLAMIGYGHSTPVTVGGKALCMAFAMVGIPLGLVMFQSIGERLNKFASVVIQRFKRCFRFRRTEATEMNLMLATGFLSTIIITTGAAVFSSYEGWSYFDSFYYCFVTLTTIGFGDYVALQNNHSLNNDILYFALCLVFILFGLAVVAASINLLVLRFMTMNTTEEVRRDDENNVQKVVLSQPQILEGEVLAGRFIAGHVIMGPNDEEDQISVCSCNCLGPSKCRNHSFDYAYEPTAPNYATLQSHRASV